eukprot:31100-Pelagococcus_subviridis.AAC.7
MCTRPSPAAGRARRRRRRAQTKERDERRRESKKCVRGGRDRATVNSRRAVANDADRPTDQPTDQTTSPLLHAEPRGGPPVEPPLDHVHLAEPLRRQRLGDFRRVAAVGVQQVHLRG